MSDLAVSTPASSIRIGAGVLAIWMVALTACSTASPSSASPAGVNAQDAEPPATTQPQVANHSAATTTSLAPPPPPPPPPPTTALPEPLAVEVESHVVEPVALLYSPPTPASITALDVPLAAVGTSDGDQAVRLQVRLLELGFWLQATDGDYGLTTRQAVMAFQKYHGLTASGSVDEQTAAMMSAEQERANGLADAGTLVEIDKSRQLLFIVVDGATAWTFNSSTGTEVPYETVNDKDPTKIERGDSVTPVGLFHTERERPEGWWAGDLGEIYRPKYFIGGIAVHGSNSIPNYPASHGCVRVSVPAMDFIWESGLMPLGINVWVHGTIPGA